jgi:hypothetical protein
VGLFGIEPKRSCGRTVLQTAGQTITSSDPYFYRADDGNRTRRILLGKQVPHLVASSALYSLEPLPRIELGLPVYETDVLPLYYGGVFLFAGSPGIEPD